MKSKKPTIHQTMSNSPGGIQATGDVNIGQQQRNLTSEQRAHLISLLLRFPKGPVRITSVMGDSESLYFAEELVEVLKVAGWHVEAIGQSTFAPTVPRGLFVVLQSPTNPPKHAGSLQSAFTAAGLDIKGQVYQQLESGVVELLVGGRP